MLRPLTDDQRDELRQWIEENDCQLYSDITSDCRCAEAYCDHVYPVFVLRTFHDPSVGIFADYISPWFKSADEVLIWLTTHQEDAARLVAAE